MKRHHHITVPANKTGQLSGWINNYLCPRGLALLFFLTFFFALPDDLFAQKYRLVIKVMSGDRREPVEGATVWINATYDPKFEGIRRKETTMEDGSA